MKKIKCEKCGESMDCYSGGRIQVCRCAWSAASCSAFWLSGWSRAVEKYENDREEFCGRMTITWKCADCMVRWGRAKDRLHYIMADKRKKLIQLPKAPERMLFRQIGLRSNATPADAGLDEKSIFEPNAKVE